MSLVLVTAPAALPLSLEEVKSHARLEGVNGEAEDALLAGYIRSATASIDAQAGWLGRALITQTWDLKLDSFPCLGSIKIPLPPLQAIVYVKYIDGSGVEQTIDASEYQVAATGDAFPAYILPSYGNTWPTPRYQPEAITVRYRCGYGDSWNDVPEPIRHALMLMCAESYCDREGEMSIPAGAMTLLGPYRVWL
jgi:uncharacterized phiE125 gp8 family phage protein